MNKIIILACMLIFGACEAQTNSTATIEFTSDLKNFEQLSALKEALKDVEIVALGENTHGLGEVFKAKTDLVKFLHQELGFDLILFESGFGDGALAWEQFDALSATAFTRSFSSNFYYNSEEIKELVEYTKAQAGTLSIQGFDCQPQQNYLIKRMTEIVQPLDSVFAKSVPLEMRSFNNLYQFENNKDTGAFNTQRDSFINFLNAYDSFLAENEQALQKAGTTINEISAIHKSIALFKSTYSEMEIGGVMGWPASYNLRDKAMFEVVKAYKEQSPKSKIIIWAQNSHVENTPKPNNNIHWMGHSLKATYGAKYYSIGAIVYSGKNLNYSGTVDFEHTDQQYLAYHLNQYQRSPFVVNLRAQDYPDFLRQPMLGMESNQNTAKFVAVERFDALLFLRYSNIPTLIKKR